MQRYNPIKIEKKWQNKWYDSDTFKAKNKTKSPKFYVLVEFPYPSGDGLHVGHCRSFVAFDAIARKKRMQGFNVLYPMGWDAFGLPTENYAIKRGVHPALVTKKNTDNFKRQMKSLGLSFDWSREINTTSPQYYKWTQWIFVQLFKKGLAYKDKISINWCPSCKIGLANEEVVSGKCERCGTKVEKKEKEQWMIKITKYADRLIDDLNLVDYQERIKIQQKEWIGRSEGAEINFSLDDFNEKIKVFTTRPDTLFGCTFLVLAPEHQIIGKIKSKIKNWQEAEKYIKQAKNKSDLERMENNKNKTGIEIKGIKAVNPANNEKMPIFISDYVMLSYGTGAIMAVPAHDERDFEFAKKYNLPVKEVVLSDGNKSILINSAQFNGMDSKKAKEEITKSVGGKKTVNYKLRDWIFSRQHYWGEPIPMVFCEECARRHDPGQGWHPVPEKDLPVELPKVKKYQPTNTGESPLASMDKWVKVACPECGGNARRETDTMPNWAGSNWYYLRYCDPKNNKKLANEKILKYWLPVDWYNGGMEHTTLHLLYSRFIFKFLWDIAAVPKQIGPEPYKKRTSHGVVLAEGGIKMSKSKGNVVNPDDVIKKYGSDTLRIYEMFMGPFEQMIPWDQKGIVGARRFLEKIYNLSEVKRTAVKSDENFKKLLHKTIKKVSEDIDLMKFNTAVSSLMEFANAWQVSQNTLGKDDFADFLAILSPLAPHLTDELWERAGFKGFCGDSKWPKYDSKLIVEESVLIIVQVNGKVRDKIKVGYNIGQKEAENVALNSSKIKGIIGGNQIKKIIFIPNKLINIVV